MTHPFSLGTPIPSIIWSSLEDVLSTNMRLFAKDIAKTLGRPEAPLLHALNAEKICPYIVEVSENRHEIDTCCSVICVKPEAPYFLQPCGNPVVWTSGAKRCMEHLCTPSAKPNSLPILRRLEYSVDEQPLYVSEDSTVYTAQNAAVGRFVDGVLVLFIVEP